MADAGLRLSVEGEKEFKASLKAIDEQMKLNRAETKLATEQYKLNNDSIDALVSKQKLLADAMEMQGQKVSLLENKYNESAKAYGETDSRVVTLKKSLLEASAAMTKITAEYEANNDVLKQQREAYDDNINAYELTGLSIDELRGKVEEYEASAKASKEELKAVAKELETGAGKTKDLAAQQANLKKQNDILNSSIADQEKKIELLNAEMKIAEARFGAQSKEVSEYREKIVAASSEVAEMKKHVEENAEALENSGDSGKKLQDALEKISEYTGIKIPEGITKMAGGFDVASVAAGGILTAVIGVGKKVGEIFKETLDWADKLNQSAQEMDIDTEAYQSLEYAAAKLGVSMDTVQDALKEINNRAGETDKIIKDQIGSLDNFSQATDEQKKAVYEAMEQWDELGVSIYDTTTGQLRPAKDIMYDLIDAYGKMSNQTEKAYKMNDMFGESYRKLNPFINAGTDLLRKFEQEAYDVGYVMESELVSKADLAANAFEMLGKRVKAALRNFVMGTTNNRNDPVGDLLDFFKTLFGIKGNAYGTQNFPGGLTWVGEKGPELVELPTGSKVYPNGVMPQSVGNSVNNYYVTIDAARVKEFNDIVRIAQTERQSTRMGYTGG